MLDKFSPQLRHALILLGGAVLTWASSKVTVIPVDVRPFASTVLAILTLAWTPLTRQYGVGSDE
jgi:hypothetical protein